MSISPWHMKDSNLNNRPKTISGKTSRTRRKYTDEQLSAFDEAVREGFSVSAAMRISKLPVSKAYEILAMNPGLKAIHENNKIKGFKK